ncbi:MAG: beta-propeller domain-containing protein [Coriobacteriales bacterium]|jgi:uncharacterized secreted protein with C-terminal beta-propeller domain|nr:beta-propeller domain-containing protein [Coriobacteriales bacterium]
MTDNIFKDMREQMTPGTSTVDELWRRIEAEPEQLEQLEQLERLDQPKQPAADAGVDAPAAPTVAPASTPVPAVASASAPVPAVAPAPATRKRGSRFARYIPAAAVMLVVAVGVTAFALSDGLGNLADKPGLTPAPTVTTPTNDSAANQQLVMASGIEVPASYQELYQSILAHSPELQYKQQLQALAEIVPGSASEAPTEDISAPLSAPDNTGMSSSDAGSGAQGEALGATPDSIPPLSAATTEDSSAATATATADAASGGNFSQTNVQVANIDEADIIKTDGNHLYALFGNDLVIFAAAGADTAEIARIALDKTAEQVSPGNSVELYLNETTLAVLYNSSTNVALYKDDSSGSSTSSWPYDFWVQNTEVLLYDVSDPSNPRYLDSFGQSGYYQSSRLYNGVLYLISNHYVYGNEVDEERPGTYVPLLSQGGQSKIMPVEDICIMPNYDFTRYVVVSSIDLAARERIDQQTVLGGGDTVYMSYGNLYIASTEWQTDESEPYQESVYTVIDYTEKSVTHLIRIGIDAGTLAPAAQTRVDGRLLNQFALDESNGYLRLAFTKDGRSYRILRDAEYGIENWQDHSSEAQTNGVLIFDPNLELAGSLTGLAEGETIQSVRFMGDIGYVVTYEQIDPLFAIDLADPYNPSVLSELKIPGFSTYLHPYGEGRLLGLGVDADGSTNNGNKLSMFDINNPTDVTELHTLALGEGYVGALYNHKAILVEPSKSLIGFGKDSYRTSSYQIEYLLFGYDDQEGFLPLASLALGDGPDAWYAGDIRGLYVDDYLYVYSGRYLDVFALDGYERLASLQVSDAEGAPYIID